MFHKKTLSLSIAMIAALGSSFGVNAQAQDEQIEEIVVTGIRASLTKGLDIKRNSFQIVDSIVAEDIGKFPDNNVVESLQRISGVQVTDRGAGEVSAVAIRGLNDVTTTINGRNIFTASGHSVALADIPASLLGRVDVYKTRSSNLIETGIAGQIDIHTQRPFDFDGRKVVVAARGIYQEQSDEIDPNISALFSNRWDTGAGEFGALVNVSFVETNYRDMSTTAGAVMPFFGAEVPDMVDEDGNPLFVPQQAIPTHINGEEIWQPGTENGLPFEAGSTVSVGGQEYEYFLSRDAIMTSDLTGKRERPAANISLQFAPNDSSEYVFEAFYNGFRDESFNNMIFSFVDGWWGNGENPMSTITQYEGTNMVKERSYIGTPYGFTSGDLFVRETDSYLYALGGKWEINEDFNVKADLAYQTSEFNEEFFAMRFERVSNAVWVDFNDHGGVPAFGYIDNPATADIDESNPADPSQWNMAQLYDNAIYRKGDATTFTVDADYALDFGPVSKITFGMRYDDRNAEEGEHLQTGELCDQGANPGCNLLANQDAGLVYINEDFFDGESDVPTSWAVANGHYIAANADYFRQFYNETTGYNEEGNAINDLTLSADRRLAKNFDVNEVNTALYVNADIETEVAGRVLDGQIGLRYVNIDTDMAFGADTASASASKVLPSLSLRYHLTDDFLARFSYGETLRRANFVQLNPSISYVRDTTNIGYGTASGGNPDLKPTESQNLDFGLEWYFAESSSIYATVFKRDIDGLVVDFRRRVTYENYDYILSSPFNAASGELEGLEVGFVYFPTNLPDVLDGFGIQASYTALDSKQSTPLTNSAGEMTGYEETPMFGVSDSSYSIVLAYEKNKFSSRLSYVWRDDFLNNYEQALFAGPLGVYRKAESSLDLQISYDVTDNLMVTFDGTNLTDELYQSYYEYPTTHNFGTSLYSRTFAVGARYTF